MKIDVAIDFPKPELQYDDDLKAIKRHWLQNNNNQFNENEI